MGSRDIGKFGWTLVALVLIVSGASDVVTPEVYPRIRDAGAEPVMQGAPVVWLAIALWLLYRQWFRRQT